MKWWTMPEGRRLLGHVLVWSNRGLLSYYRREASVKAGLKLWLRTQLILKNLFVTNQSKICKLQQQQSGAPGMRKLLKLLCIYKCLYLSWHLPPLEGLARLFEPSTAAAAGRITYIARSTLDSLNII